MSENSKADARECVSERVQAAHQLRQIAKEYEGETEIKFTPRLVSKLADLLDPPEPQQEDR